MPGIPFNFLNAPVINTFSGGPSYIPQGGLIGAGLGGSSDSYAQSDPGLGGSLLSNGFPQDGGGVLTGTPNMSGTPIGSLLAGFAGNQGGGNGNPFGGQFDLQSLIQRLTPNPSPSQSSDDHWQSLISMLMQRLGVGVGGGNSGFGGGGGTPLLPTFSFSGIYSR